MPWGGKWQQIPGHSKAIAWRGDAVRLGLHRAIPPPPDCRKHRQMPQSEKLCLACGNWMGQLARTCPHCGADHLQRTGATPSFGKAKGFGRAQTAAGSTQSGGFQQRRQTPKDDHFSRADKAGRYANTAAIEPDVAGFTDAVFSCFAKYARFRGRANRAEYWYFFLFLIIIGLVLSILDSSVRGPMKNMLSTIGSLATLLPSIAVSVRRMHDLDKSGFYVLLGYIGYLLFIAAAVVLVAAKLKNVPSDLSNPLMIAGCALIVWQLVLYCLPGTPGPNRYGPATRSW